MLRLALPCTIALVGCQIHDVDLTGKDCPCPSGWVCSAVTNTCTRTDDTPDAPGPDAIDGSMRTTYRDAVMSDAPIAYWRLGDTGPIAHDELGNVDGHYSDTCVHGVAGALAGDSDPAVHFNGTSCKVTLPDQLGFPGVKPYSIEAWLDESGAAAAGFRVVFSKETRATGPENGYALVDSNNGIYFERAVAKVAPTTTHTAHPIGEFVHVVGVYDGTSFVLYINATPTAKVSDTRAMPAYSAEALIGADSSGDFFAGELDEVAVYDHALTIERITLHHDIGVSGPR